MIRPGIILSLAVLFGGTAGCDRATPQDLAKLRSNVLVADPTFAEPLKKHDELASRVQVLEREIELKRTEIEDQIAKLRAELVEATKQTKRQVADLKAQLNPDVERVELTLAMAREELKGKQRQRGALGRSISRLRKSIKQTQAPEGDLERSKLDQELGTHLEEITRLDKELAALAEHIKLLEAKRKLLNF